MNTEVLLVEQRALRCVEVTRTLSLEVPVGVRDPRDLAALIEVGERNFGPFGAYYVPVSGTEKLGHLEVRIIGTAGEPADIPLATESEVGG